MAKRSKTGSRKIKTAAELQREADQRKRDLLIGTGLPAHRVEGAKVHEFKEESFADLKSRQRVIRSLFSNPADRWLAEGGPGFEEPQRRAINHCRSLWASLGSRSLTANYNGVGGGECDGHEQEIFARAQLGEYQDQFPTAYWMVFENVVRFEMPAGRAASHLDRHPAARIAAARNTVGFVASKIAEWRGYGGTDEAPQEFRSIATRKSA